jgi:hypothetical protein
MLDVGQVIEIEPGQQPNDEKLIRLGLLRALSQKPVQCGKCGLLFADEGFLSRHGRAHHAMTYVDSGRSEARSKLQIMADRAAGVGLDANGERDVVDVDRVTAEQIGRLKALEVADEFAEKSIPLNLDKTKASREGHRASR